MQLLLGQQWPVQQYPVVLHLFVLLVELVQPQKFALHLQQLVVLNIAVQELQ